MWRKGKTPVLLVGVSTDTATMKKSRKIPQKTKSGTTYDLAVPLLGICPERIITQRHAPQSSLQRFLQ